MALGNPSSATTDPSKTNNYLIVRSQYAMSYNGITHQPNWVSWSLSTNSLGSANRTDAWSQETLPAGYYRVGTATFGTSYGLNWDRGHMCPSADRTSTTLDNELTFRMSNIIPQAATNNQRLWADFETYCRGLITNTISQKDNEVLIISGPSEFTGNRLSNLMAIPGSVWKIAVVTSNSSSGFTASQRINTNMFNIRVIALLTPNVNTGLGSWQSYITSVEEIEQVTGFNFFTNLDPTVATYL